MDRKQLILNQVFGYPAFREGQEALMDAQLAGRDVFGIMPTGGGKSLCYQVPALVMEGVTFVISPLISLMKDQVMALKNAGIPAAYINSSLTPEQIRLVYRNIRDLRYKIIYVAPERLMGEGFLAAACSIPVSMVAVDEAHCISQWGQDFRPSYLRITEFIEALPRRPVVSAFTATATAQVQADVMRILKLQNPLKIVTGFDRPNLTFYVERPRDKQTAVLEHVLRRSGKCGIIYCATRKDVETVCDLLRQRGLPATRYHAGLEEAERRGNQEDFIYDRAPIMVATNAFGMGIDKSNVSYVLHYSMPKSLEAYYQEAGRAGRDGQKADCILFYGIRDVIIAKFLIQASQENEELTPEDRACIREQDLLRLKAMEGYCKTLGCLRGYILDYFGQNHAVKCGSCGNCFASGSEMDITKEAQMALSCIYRIRDRLGYGLNPSVVARVLRGSQNKEALALGLDSLPTYGILKGRSQTELRELLDDLEAMGFITLDDRNAACLTEAAKEVLFRGMPVKVRVRQEKKAPPAPPKSSEPLDASTLDALKDLRTRLAVSQGVPSYIIFSNATLEEMARRKPTTMADLLKVPGVGEYKAERYGKAFLAVLRK